MLQDKVKNAFIEIDPDLKAKDITQSFKYISASYFVLLIINSSLKPPVGFKKQRKAKSKTTKKKKVEVKT